MSAVCPSAPHPPPPCVPQPTNTTPSLPLKEAIYMFHYSILPAHGGAKVTVEAFC